MVQLLTIKLSVVKNMMELEYNAGNLVQLKVDWPIDDEDNEVKQALVALEQAIGKQWERKQS